MKIVFFGLEAKNQKVFEGVFVGAETIFFEEKLGENNAALGQDADAICVFVSDLVNKTIIDAMPNLKFIATRSTGYNHIDVAYANEKGIQVAYVPGYGSYTVAEFAFGLILSLSRKIIFANLSLRQTEDFNYHEVMEGFDLKDKILGVIGTGKIGKNAVKIAKGFSMQVIACDLYPDQDFAREHNFEYKTLAEVVAQADIITMHAPYTKDNHHLIGKEEVQKMKKGVYVINTARGELLDTEALYQGLKEGIVAGAGLDVLEEERGLRKGETSKICKFNRELMQMPNVIITPHIAFFSKEAVTEIMKTTAENIKSFLSGAPKNLVKS